MNNRFTIGSVAKAIEDAAKPIWEQIFQCKIAAKDNISDVDLEYFGMPSVGDFQIDADIRHQVILVYFTINKMTDLYKKGIPFSVAVHEDTKRIYDIIQNYLHIWKGYLEHGINIGGAPLDDLILLDKFAASVHAHAQVHFTREYVNSKLLNRLGDESGMGLSRDDFFKPTAKQIEQTPAPKHESLADIFSERIIRGRGR